MGNCPCPADTRTLENLVFTALVKSIDDSNTQMLREILQKHFLTPSKRFLDINHPIIPYRSQKINALTYSLLKGKTQILIDLIEIGGAKMYVMEQELRKIHKTSMGIICGRGYLEILEYLFPAYLSKRNSLPSVSKYSAAQLACKNGHIDILRYFKKMFRYRTVPDNYDVHWISNKTGFNCALISAKTHNLSMMKFLYEECGADFNHTTDEDHSALSLAISSYKKQRSLESIQYLVETVNLPINDIVISSEMSKNLVNYLDYVLRTYEDTLSLSSRQINEDEVSIGIHSVLNNSTP